MFTPEALAGYVSAGIFVVINLLVAYVILKLLLFKPLLKLLRKRRELVVSQLEDADQKMASARQSLSKANEKLDQSNHEAAEIIASARAMAETESESLIGQARQEAAHIMSRADSEMKRLRTAMLQDMRDEVADLSVAIATKVIGQVLDEDKQRAMIARMIEDEPRLQEESPVTERHQIDSRNQDMSHEV